MKRWRTFRCDLILNIKCWRLSNMEFMNLWMMVFAFLHVFLPLSIVFGESVVGLENPYFQPQEVNVVNATTPLGATTFLPCQVNKLGGKIVSWLKRIGEDKEPHLLTYGRQTYSNDPRFSIQIQPNSWTLQIKSTKKSDAGHYECQVSSDPPLIQYTFLNVVVPTKKIIKDRHLE